MWRGVTSVGVMDATSLPIPAEEPIGAMPATVLIEDLYLQEYRGLVRLAYLLVDTDAEAEEVVQDAFAKLLVRWSSVRNPGAYLRRSVLNGCRDVQRRRATKRAHPDEPEVAVDAPADHVMDAVRALSPRRRAVVVLRFYEDLTIDQIADVLRTRPGTVKSLLHRALKDLEKVVER
jgi:RNA polymerase sigma factor (sigma-70 family)